MVDVEEEEVLSSRREGNLEYQKSDMGETEFRDLGVTGLVWDFAWVVRG